MFMILNKEIMNIWEMLMSFAEKLMIPGTAIMNISALIMIRSVRITIRFRKIMNIGPKLMNSGPLFAIRYGGLDVLADDLLLRPAPRVAAYGSPSARITAAAVPSSRMGLPRSTSSCVRSNRITCRSGSRWA